MFGIGSTHYFSYFELLKKKKKFDMYTIFL